MVNIGDEVRVCFPVYSEYTVQVAVTADMLDAEGEVDMDLVIDASYEELPSGLCYGCSTGNSGVGFGEPAPVSLEIGESPEATYALDSAGKVVWGDIDAKLGW